ncbi:MAG: DUF2779 domain-containing protein [Nitrosarchaeum sp.]|nr:DUF2779 domain-containing protein [Nitrosarchaeum sp.]
MTLLTKSLFVMGMGCPALLWYAVNEPEYLPPPDASAQRRMRLGSEAGAYARNYFPGGIFIQGKEALAQTRALLEQAKPLYEATFTHQNLLCKVDVLLKAQDKYDIVEVKSSTSVKPEHLYDVAFQTHVLKKEGLGIARSCILHINSTYNRKEQLEPQELFTLVDVTEQIAPILETIEEDIKRLQSVLAGPKPDVPPGKHCANAKCPLALKANSALPEHNVTQLYRNTGSTFLEQGIIKIADIQGGLNKKQFIQYQATRDNTVAVNKKHLKQWLDGLNHPITHFDFETIDFALPKWINTRPYMQIPFQYSAHIEHQDGQIEHIEYLHTGEDDPRPALLKHMNDHLPKKELSLRTTPRSRRIDSRSSPLPSQTTPPSSTTSSRD